MKASKASIWNYISEVNAEPTTGGEVEGGKAGTCFNCSAVRA
jgi:hypothetical protein